MFVVVYGAGAVGSVLGGLLSVHNHDVLLVGRSQLSDAINGDGLRLRSATGDYVARPRVTETLAPSDIPQECCVLLTAKSNATELCVRELSEAVPVQTPIVAFQNGVGNEERIASRFENVYGGVCRMTCSMLQPGHASFRRFGRLIVGKYPKGSDAVCRSLTKAFSGAGFDSCSSRNISNDKWLKLAVNTQSAFHAVVDPRDHDTNEFLELKALILTETRDVFKAAKIKTKSCDGKDPSIEEMIEDLRRPRARRSDRGMKVHNSTWQDLYLKRDVIESAYFHQPVIGLGKEHGVETPYNHVALELVTQCHGSGNGPESIRLDDVLQTIADRKQSE